MENAKERWFFLLCWLQENVQVMLLREKVPGENEGKYAFPYMQSDSQSWDNCTGNPGTTTVLLETRSWANLYVNMHF